VLYLAHARRRASLIFVFLFHLFCPLWLASRPLLSCMPPWMLSCVARISHLTPFFVCVLFSRVVLCVWCGVSLCPSLLFFVGALPVIHLLLDYPSV
jgi:hypothetical protein